MGHEATLKFVDRAVVRHYTGDALIDVSAAVYTGFIALFTITAPAGKAMRDVRVSLDLAKATTGFAAVNTDETIQFCVARKVDGTNYRNDAEVQTTAISGTNAAGRSVTLTVGDVLAGEEAKVMVILSAETGGDCEIPYRVVYRCDEQATFADTY